MDCRPCLFHMEEQLGRDEGARGGTGSSTKRTRPQVQAGADVALHPRWPRNPATKAKS
jgi:hypothetical protein